MIGHRVDPGFVIDDVEPAYLALARSGELADRVAAGLAELAPCRVCPRDCDVDRLAGETGACRAGRLAVVASAFPHHGEEDCLRGRNGSGTIFFGGCNLRCVFCQNWETSQRAAGPESTATEIADLMVRLQAHGCHNINLVTPEHVVPQVLEAVALAVPRGLRLPLVYNTSAYDALRSLELLDGLVDIYMPDVKFWEPATARRLARAADYPARMRAAVTEMHRQVGPLRFGSDGLARRGLLVRHLVMPGQPAEAAAIMGWLASDVSADTYVNVMGQYRPDHRVPGNHRYADVDRRPRRDEVAAVRRAARDAGSGGWTTGAERGRIRVGLSGWDDPSWRGDVYPVTLPRSDELAFIGRRFDTVEVNATFYELAKPSTFDRWCLAVPRGFVFAVKGSRYITHVKKLADVNVAFANFFASGVLELGNKLGPVVWQLPGHVHLRPTGSSTS